MTKSTYQYINLDYMYLMSDNDEDMLMVMIDMLLEELPIEMEKIHQFAEAEDWENLKQVSHKMKSTLAFVGNDVLTESNKEIEHIAKTKTNLYKLPELLANLNNFTPKTIVELKQEQSRLG